MTNPKKRKSERIAKAAATGLAAGGIEEGARMTYQAARERLFEAAEDSPSHVPTIQLGEEDTIPVHDLENLLEHHTLADIANDHGGVHHISWTTLDLDGDQIPDVLITDAELVDGTNYTYLELGEELDPLFDGELEMASPEEMEDADLFDPGDLQLMDAASYHIVTGDTLSEIALSHGSTVEELMALNPQIEDPDLIYAGDDLLVPHASEAPLEILDWDDDVTDEAVVDMDVLEPESEFEGGEDFEQIDWDQFEEGTAGDYNDALDQMDFHNMGDTGVYVDDGIGDLDWDELDSSLGFY